MKRPASAEQTTPKKRPKPRDHRTVSPSATSPTENLESVVQKLSASSDSADMDMSDGVGPEMAICGDKDVENIEAPRQGSDSSPDDAIIVDASPCKQLKREHQLSQLAADADAGGSHPSTTPGIVGTSEWLLEKLDILTPPTLSSDSNVIVQKLHEMEAGVVRLLEKHHALTPSMPSSDRDAITQELREIEAGVVRLLEKLHTLTPSMLPSDRDAIIQEVCEMEAGLTGLPLTNLHHPPVHLRRNEQAERLQLVETLIGPQLLRIPDHAWRVYKSKLLRLCARRDLHKMDFWKRFRKVRKVVYLPEEVQLLLHRDVERMQCAVRMCATVTEILGPEEEQVPVRMSAWVTEQLRYVVWKAKVTSVSHKYWPESEVMVID